MARRPRRNHSPAFKAKVAVAAIKGEKTMTGALLDRLTQHVNILEMNGESYRLAQSRAHKIDDNTWSKASDLDLTVQGGHSLLRSAIARHQRSVAKHSPSLAGGWVFADRGAGMRASRAQ